MLQSWVYVLIRCVWGHVVQVPRPRTRIDSGSVSPRQPYVRPGWRTHGKQPSQPVGWECCDAMLRVCCGPDHDH
ncbi:hypothetical protein B9M85_04835 [Mycobacteroides abscessus]|nr:hypothetical protein B9M85_04835 [Mycobacteroides abscessus]